MDITQAIVTRVGELCNARAITINGLSNRSGVTQSTVHDVMSGKTHNPGIATIKKLCDGLDLTVKDFFAVELFQDLDQEIR